MTASLSTMANGHTWFEWTAKPAFERHLLPWKERRVNALQLGAFIGDASLWLLLNFPTLHLTDVDTWGGSEELEEHDFDEVWRIYNARMERFVHAERLVLRRTTTTEFLRTCNHTYDFIYVDADHHAEAALSDAVHAWRLLRPGGLMAFDDYASWDSDDTLRWPRRGVRAFVDTFAHHLDVVEQDSQLWVRKR